MSEANNKVLPKAGSYIMGKGAALPNLFTLHYYLFTEICRVSSPTNFNKKDRLAPVRVVW